MTSAMAILLERGQADAHLLSSPVNIGYVCGFFGDDSHLLVMPTGAFLFTDSRYTEQARRDLRETDVETVVTDPGDRHAAIRERLAHEAPDFVLGIEEQYLTVSEFQSLRDAGVIHNHVDNSETLLEMRSIKTKDEIGKISTAAQATEDVLAAVLPYIEVGVRECDIRARLLYEIFRRGMDSAFEPIVAGGSNGAMPHARTTEYTLRHGDLLTLDFGCRYEGYCADMTRTFAIGHIDDDLKRIYDVVEQAQQKALEAAKPGIEACRIDEVARSFITEQGYGEAFGHGTGHGVGLQIHELPIINPSSTAILSEGMVFTIEPGIYLAGKGGVRIEDTCVAGRGSLFTFSKRLIEL